MSDTIIRVENVSKLYRLGEVGTGTISHDLNRWWHRVRGKEDPYLKIGQTNDRTKKGDSEYSWALKDVSFEVKRGEVLGIIGRNGAGKSTLLKILSRVTTPTSGEIKVKGRIASLLEVGTGFNPELTGRDNIYLNGAILGMRTREIAQKFDEIVAFAEVDRYIDTPVKRYSSGMYVRLAFAVAAHLEPEILIVDEVLAVGDAAFQKKCLGKMGEVAREGRTVLFVSHTMTAVKTLTNRVILMDQGNIAVNSHPDEAISKYLEMSSDNSNDYFITKSEGTHTNVTKLSMLDQNGKNTDFYIPGTKFIFEIHFTTDGTQQMSLELFLADSKKNRIAFASPAHFNEVFLPTKAGKYVCRMELHSIFLASGSYCVDVATALSNKAWDHQIERAITFIVPFSNPNNLSWDFKQTYGYGVFAWVQSKESEISFTKVI